MKFALFIILTLRLASLNHPVKAYSDYYCAKAQLSAEHKQSSDTEAYYHKAIHHNRQNPEPYFQLGLYSELAGDEKQVLKYFKKVTELNGSKKPYAKAYLLVGIDLLTNQKIPEAIEHLRKSIFLDEGSHASYYYLGKIYYTQGKTDLASQMAGKIAILMNSSELSTTAGKPWLDKLQELIDRKE